MDIKDAEYFFTNYVGYAPDDALKVKQTNEMICHYVDSGLEEQLPKIYEVCAKDEVLNKDNIPKQLWKDGNLLEDAFYLHPALTLRNHAPELDPITGQIREYPYYRENIEYFSMDDLLRFASGNLKHDDVIDTEREDRGAAFHLLKRYEPLKKEGIQPLDVVLFLVSESRGEKIRLLHVSEKEDEVLEMLRNYKKKLEEMGRNHAVWRGCLD